MMLYVIMRSCGHGNSTKTKIPFTPKTKTLRGYVDVGVACLYGCCVERYLTWANIEVHHHVGFKT
eukprot:scaffold77650_cov50-Cyclotella_meneghiniana.AAC.1